MRTTWVPVPYTAICSADPTSADCAAAIASARETLGSGIIGQELFALIRAIAERAPNAQIIVTDYPMPFVAGWSPATDAVNGATVSLDDKIEGAVAAAAFGGVSVELASVA